MRYNYSLILCLIFLTSLPFDSESQDNTGLSKYIRLLPASEGARNHYLEISSDVDSTWWRWQYRGYNFGFDKKVTPMYTTINGILSTPYMIQVVIKIKGKWMRVAVEEFSKGVVYPF